MRNVAYKKFIATIALHFAIEVKCEVESLSAMRLLMRQNPGHINSGMFGPLRIPYDNIILYSTHRSLIMLPWRENAPEKCTHYA